MKKLLLMLTLCVGIACFAGCNSQKKSKDGEGKRDVVEILYFQGAQRCKSCVVAEQIVQSVLQEQFSDAIEQGKLRYRTINIVEQEEIANEYEIVWSSLLLVDYDANGERVIEDLTDIAFLNADKLSNELSNRITTMLNN